MTQADADYELPSSPGPRPRYRLTRRGKVVFTVLPLAILASIWLLTSGGGGVQIAGLENGAVIGPPQANVTIELAKETDPAAVTVTVDDEELEAAQSAPNAFVVDLSGLPDGEHRLTVVVDRSFPFRSLRAAREFVLDTTPPSIEVLSPTDPVPVNQEVTVSVRVAADDIAAVTIDGEQAAPDENGTISKTYPEPPDAGVVITATDAVGNTAEELVPIELALAGAPGAPPMIGVHATGWTWATPELKDPIMEMIDAGLINTVELDLKDEGGDVWYDTGVELAHEIGAVTELYDLEQAVEELHAKGVRVVGRIVNFRDPRLANYAVQNGHLDWVIQNPDGSAYGQYGGFTNPFDPDVREYNMALAEEAARLGVDDIMYDYVRRPDTPRRSSTGQDGAEDAIVSFSPRAGAGPRRWRPAGGRRVRHRRHRPHRSPRTSSHGRRGRLHRPDDLPVPLGTGRVRRRTPTPSPRHHVPVAVRLRAAGRGHRGLHRRLVGLLPGSSTARPSPSADRRRPRRRVEHILLWDAARPTRGRPRPHRGMTSADRQGPAVTSSPVRPGCRSAPGVARGCDAPPRPPR